MSTSATAVEYLPPKAITRPPSAVASVSPLLGEVRSPTTLHLSVAGLNTSAVRMLCPDQPPATSTRIPPSSGLLYEAQPWLDLPSPRSPTLLHFPVSQLKMKEQVGQGCPPVNKISWVEILLAQPSVEAASGRYCPATQPVCGLQTSVLSSSVPPINSREFL